MTTGDRPIDFTRGVPADESFPLAELAECAAAVVAGPHGVLVQQYGPSPGFGPLREWLAAQHLTTTRVAASGRSQLEGHRPSLASVARASSAWTGSID